MFPLRTLAGHVMARRRTHSAPPGSRPEPDTLPSEGPAFFDTRRVEAFSDGVFAIAITLLVLDLKLPALPAAPTNADLLQALIRLEPTALSYLVSFLVIGSFWVSHHRLFEAVRHVSPRMLWLNLVLLLCVSFLPFPTTVLGQYGDLAVAEDLYAISLAAAGVCFTSLIWYADRAGLINPDVLVLPVRMYLLRAMGVPVVAVLVIIVAIGAPGDAAYIWLLTAVLNITLGRIGRRPSPGGTAEPG